MSAAPARKAVAEIYQFVRGVGGTISAEHGIGIAKTPWLHLVRNAGELESLASIKRALDPHGILNPGVLDPLR